MNENTLNIISTTICLLTIGFLIGAICTIDFLQADKIWQDGFDKGKEEGKQTAFEEARFVLNETKVFTIPQMLKIAQAYTELCK